MYQIYSHSHWIYPHSHWIYQIPCRTDQKHHLIVRIIEDRVLGDSEDSAHTWIDQKHQLMYSRPQLIYQ